jgi:hypothetical protein
MYASRKAGAVFTVSPRALMHFRAILGSLDQYGIPHQLVAAVVEKDGSSLHGCPY